NQPPLKSLSGREVFNIAGRAYRWEQVFLWVMARGEWERLLDRFRLTLASAKAFRLAGRRNARSHVEDAAEVIRYYHRLENAAAMRRWLNYWRLTPERWRRAILLQAVQPQVTEAEIMASAKRGQSTEAEIIRWLRPLGAVSGAFQELAEAFAGHAAIHDFL